MNSRNAAFAAVGLAFLALASYAQVATVEGDVIGTDGKPVVGAIIKLHRTDIKWDSQTKTDKKGHYIHAGVPLGMYEIACLIDGKEVDKISGYKSTLGDHPPIVFDMRKNGPTASAARQAEIQ